MAAYESKPLQIVRAGVDWTSAVDMQRLGDAIGQELAGEVMGPYSYHMSEDSRRAFFSSVLAPICGTLGAALGPEKALDMLAAMSELIESEAARWSKVRN